MKLRVGVWGLKSLSAVPVGPHSPGSIFPVLGQIQTTIRMKSKPQFSKSGKISLLL